MYAGDAIQDTSKLSNSGGSFRPSSESGIPYIGDIDQVTCTPGSAYPGWGPDYSSVLNGVNHSYMGQGGEFDGNTINEGGGGGGGGRYTQNVGNIKPMPPTVHDYIHASVKINRMPPIVYETYKFGYALTNDLFVALQSLIILNPINLDFTYTTPREKLISGVNAATMLMPIGEMREIGLYGKTVNAGQFGTLFKGTGITAATDGGVHIRMFNYVERNAQQFTPLYNNLNMIQTVFPYLYQSVNH